MDKVDVNRAGVHSGVLVLDSQQTQDDGIEDESPRMSARGVAHSRRTRVSEAVAARLLSIVDMGVRNHD
jgi:hypothetical protein